DVAQEDDGFAREMRADEVLARRGRVAFVEDEIKDGEERLEARRQLIARRQLERELLLADRALGAHEPLRDGVALRQQRAGDLVDAEAARGFERQGDTALRRNGGMTAEQHQAERGVAELVREAPSVGVLR